MMQRIREKTAGWFAAGVVIAIAIVFTLWGVYGYLGTNAGENNAVAKVNGEDIDKKAFQMAYQRELESQMQSQQKVDPTELKTRVLDGMIEDTLRLQDAQKNHFLVGRKLVDDFIASTPEFQQNGKFSLDLFERFLAQMGQTPSGYYKLVNESLAQYYMQIALAGSEFELPFEADRDFSIAEQKRVIDYVVVPIENYLNQVTVSDEQIKNFYNEHQKQFISPEQVSINYVVLSSKDLMAQIAPTDEDLKKYFDENQQRFKIPEERKVQHILISMPAGASPEIEEEQKKKADDIMTQLKSGVDFGDLAKKYSDDTGSAQEGGDLGWLPRGAAVKPFDDAVFSAKTGDIVGPVKTPFGFHIIKLEEIKPEAIPAFETVKPQVTADYQQEKAVDEFTKKQEDLAQLTYENQKSLDDVAKKLNLTVQKSVPFTRQGHVKDELAGNPAIVEAAYSEAVLAGNNSPVITLVPNEKVIVLRLADHQPETQQPLDQVKLEIENILKYEAASKVAEQKVQEMLLNLKANGTLEQLATSLNTTVVHVEAGRFEFTKVDPSLLRYIFSMAKPSATYKAIGETQMTNGNFAVVSLTDVKPGDVATEQKSLLESYAKSLAQIRSQLDYDLYIKGLSASAGNKIKKYE